jgi:serine/threonine protein kinase
MTEQQQTEVLGRYRVDGTIAAGGTATVHRAHDLRLGRDVALKRVRPGLGRAQHRLRLRDEGRLLADLRHPGLVRVLDAAWEGHGAPYLVLELVDGPDLATVLTDGPLDPQRVAAIGRDVASALAYLHSEGIVHRDVKPANVLLDPSGSARICDLGISLDVGEPDPHGRPGHTVGSLAYLAPEQVLGEAIGTAVDVFALGLMLLESLTGHREYSGPDDSSAWARVHRSPAIPTSLGAAWTRLLAAMTARVPAERPSAADVAAHLEAMLAVEDATADVATPQAATAGTRTATATGVTTPGRHRAGRPVQDLAATVA